MQEDRRYAPLARRTAPDEPQPRRMTMPHEENPPVDLPHEPVLPSQAERSADEDGTAR